MAEIYYVYEHVRLDTNKIFYVGKGKCNRAYSFKNRNKHWHNVVNKVGFAYRIVVQNIDEELAFLVEQELITKYKNLNYNLVNYTAGGEGFSGGKHTKESRNKMSIRATGRTPHNKGKKHSEETKRKMSLARIGKSPSNKGKPKSKETKDKMSKAKIGLFVNYKWWTDGVKNTRSKECPGEKWKLGQTRGK